MTDRPIPPPDPTVEELRARAAEYRRMAETATSAGTRESLIRLAERYETEATKKETEAG